MKISGCLLFAIILLFSTFCRQNSSHKGGIVIEGVEWRGKKLVAKNGYLWKPGNPIVVNNDTIQSFKLVSSTGGEDPPVAAICSCGWNWGLSACAGQYNDGTIYGCSGDCIPSNNPDHGADCAPRLVVSPRPD